MNPDSEETQIAFITPEYNNTLNGSTQDNTQAPNNETNLLKEEQKKEKEEKKRKLTRKQKLWLKYYLESGNKTQAAIKAYDLNPNNEDDQITAGSIGYQNFKKLHVDELMEDMGLSDVFLLKVLAQGIVKPTKFEKVASNNRSEEYKEIIDYQTRHKYLETALKIKGKIGNSKDQSANNNNFYGDLVFQFTDSTNNEPQVDTTAIDAELV